SDPLYALSFSMPPGVLMTYIQPHRYGSFRDGYFMDREAGAWDRRAYNEYGLYVGLPTLLLAAMAFGSRRKIAAGLLLIGLVALLLALGGNTDPSRIMSGNFEEIPQPGNSLHEWFLRLFPPAEGFRVPARISILATFSLITLAAIGLNFLASRSSS